jgi:hypothetical protein
MSRPSTVGKRFDFKENGNGLITHEAKVDYKSWSPVVQVLKFTDTEHNGDTQLRFGYLNDDGTLIARPLYLDEDQLEDLGKAAARNPEIKSMLKRFVESLL